MRNTTVTKVAKGRPRKHKLSIAHIKKAISKFITNTEKIIRSVDPDAKIVMSSPKPPMKKSGRPKKIIEEKPKIVKKLPKAEKANPDKEKIIVPQFREISPSEISDNQSIENTDDEVYEEFHSHSEKIESLLRSRPDIRRIKAHGRSTNGVHSKGQTYENWKRSLKKFGMYTPEDIMVNYWTEGIGGLPYEIQEPVEDVVIELDN
ncbi:unnamed protein product [Blepharisma stoltei]|uniref:Uncharacterized protein n=1 Tax=Blepharisma stoltei TaxID=1481888 RepID=A0AAU9JFH6_9CILI|nr:unnamed protein product [Blepharisma stoltei]